MLAWVSQPQTGLSSGRIRRVGLGLRLRGQMWHLLCYLVSERQDDSSVTHPSARGGPLSLVAVKKIPEKDSGRPLRDRGPTSGAKGELL